MLLLVLAYAADTITTLEAGNKIWQEDINPLIRNLTPTGYCISAVLRGLFAVVVLIWFWPSTLQVRNAKHSWLALLVPFSYKNPVNYFGAVLIMIATPVKALAALNNFYLNRGIMLSLSPLVLILLGLLSGILYSNILFYWHARKSRPLPDVE